MLTEEVYTYTLKTEKVHKISFYPTFGQATYFFSVQFRLQFVCSWHKIFIFQYDFIIHKECYSFKGLERLAKPPFYSIRSSKELLIDDYMVLVRKANLTITFTMYQSKPNYFLDISNYYLFFSHIKLKTNLL